MSTSLYERDLADWSGRQADALRRRAGNEIDWDNVAEEIDAVGRSVRFELGNRIATVLEHLIKLQASPGIAPRNTWRATIVRSRAEIASLLDDSPSVRPLVAGMIAEKLTTARRLAMLSLDEYGEAPLVDLETLAYTEDQVLGEWLP
jgi:hypothetical protein